MGELPRLPPQMEHRVLKAACGLAPRVQRRLFGPPPRIDGQTLASDAHALLRMAEWVGGASIVQGLALGELRERTRLESAIVTAQPPIPMARVEAVEIPGQAGTIPARLYVPAGPRPSGAGGGRNSGGSPRWCARCRAASPTGCRASRAGWAWLRCGGGHRSGAAFGLVLWPV